MKRYCQTLELVDNPKLIAKYCEIHAEQFHQSVSCQRRNFRRLLLKEVRPVSESCR